MLLQIYHLIESFRNKFNGCRLTLLFIFLRFRIKSYLSFATVALLSLLCKPQQALEKSIMFHHNLGTDMKFYFIAMVLEDFLKLLVLLFNEAT